jgi:hypothetical protein
MRARLLPIALDLLPPALVARARHSAALLQRGGRPRGSIDVVEVDVGAGSGGGGSGWRQLRRVLGRRRALLVGMLVLMLLLEQQDGVEQLRGGAGGGGSCGSCWPRVAFGKRGDARAHDIGVVDCAAGDGLRRK